MEKIVLSFRPEIYPALNSGLKRYEYRRSFPEGDVVAYIYLSHPVKKIVGKLCLGERIPIEDLMDSYKSNEQVRKRLERHIKEVARFAVPIVSITHFVSSLSLEDLRENVTSFFAPQSYTYVKNNRKLEELLVKQKVKSVIEFDDMIPDELVGLFSNEIYSSAEYADNEGLAEFGLPQKNLKSMI